MKKLSGTIHDDPSASGTLGSVKTTPPADEYTSISSIGFGTPHPSHPHSPALQRQVASLESDRHADYFLFDCTDRPIRVVFDDRNIRTVFRMIRSEAMFGAEPSGNVHAMAEHLIKTMANQPGLSRARILAQFEREYGGNMAAEVAAFVAKGIEYGEPGSTFLERMGVGVAARFPNLYRSR